MAWAGVAVAATDRREKIGAIVAAALSLPGLGVHAESAPERAEVALRYLSYQDAQPGLKRIRVKAPSLYLLTPLGSRWSLEASAVSDQVSGATPRYHSATSGATPRMSDERHAADVKVTRYFERSSWSLGYAGSKENDYRSSALSLGAAFASDDNNTVVNIGLGRSADRIGSTNDRTLAERKRTSEFMVGLTQAWTANDLVQFNLTYNTGRGFYSDPYKEPDIRPRERRQRIALARWNHHFSGWQSTLKTSYRYYGDSFGIKAHTVAAEWVQPVASRITVTPSLRYYTQSAARFYYDPVYDPDVGAPYPPGYFANPPAFISPDQRLAAFGGWTVGLKLNLRFDEDWSFDLKAERYEQRAGWRLGGQGSPGIDTFTATFWQLGVSRRF